jgi:hypothetical protein
MLRSISKHVGLVHVNVVTMMRATIQHLRPKRMLVNNAHWLDHMVAIKTTLNLLLTLIMHGASWSVIQDIPLLVNVRSNAKRLPANMIPRFKVVSEQLLHQSNIPRRPRSLSMVKYGQHASVVMSNVKTGTREAVKLSASKVSGSKKTNAPNTLGAANHPIHQMVNTLASTNMSIWVLIWAPLHTEVRLSMVSHTITLDVNDTTMVPTMHTMKTDPILKRMTDIALMFGRVMK